MYPYVATHRRVIVTPAVYPRLVEFLHFDIQSTGQKSHCVNTAFQPSQCYVLIRQSDSPCPYQFQVSCSLGFGRVSWKGVQRDIPEGIPHTPSNHTNPPPNNPPT